MRVFILILISSLSILGILFINQIINQYFQDKTCCLICNKLGIQDGWAASVPIDLDVCICSDKTIIVMENSKE